MLASVLCNMYLFNCSVMLMTPWTQWSGRRVIHFSQSQVKPISFNPHNKSKKLSDLYSTFAKMEIKEHFGLVIEDELNFVSKCYNKIRSIHKKDCKKSHVFLQIKYIITGICDTDRKSVV